MLVGLEENEEGAGSCFATSIEARGLDVLGSDIDAGAAGNVVTGADVGGRVRLLGTEARVGGVEGDSGSFPEEAAALDDDLDVGEVEVEVVAVAAEKLEDPRFQPFSETGAVPFAWGVVAVEVAGEVTFAVVDVIGVELGAVAGREVRVAAGEGS